MDIRDRKEQLATDILKLTRLRLQMKLPVMSGALLLPEWKYRNDGKSTGTDGIWSVLESGGGAPLVSRVHRYRWSGDICIWFFTACIFIRCGNQPLKRPYGIWPVI